MDWLLQLDTTLLFLVNRGWAWPPADVFFLTITKMQNWLPVLIPLFIWLMWKGGPQGRWAVLLIIPLIAVTDPFASWFLKAWIGRPRPCVALPDVRLITPILTSGSMPSSHAVNSFAAATHFGFHYPRWRYVFLFLAALVGLSRVYLGLHYPLDVVIGAGIGIAAAWGMWGVYNLLPARWKPPPAQGPSNILKASS